MSAHAFQLAPHLDTPLARDVAQGLSHRYQKSLPSKYLYDELGSILFDAITVLPEYGLTRADARLLQTNADAIVASLPNNLTVAELGSGTGSKTRWILEAAARNSKSPVLYQPIDISETAVMQCTKIMETLDGVTVSPQNATYIEGLEAITRERRPNQPLLLLFLGSTIGNFDYSAARFFLREIRSLLRSGDALLLGTDLVKPLPQMLAAYDDPTGVTAAFNMNLLGRMNRELDANFNLRSFRHEARFNQAESRIEMHLLSLCSQTVEIAALGERYTFANGETIWTEGSYKFRRPEVVALVAETGFSIGDQWVDQEWPFAETLMLAA